MSPVERWVSSGLPWGEGHWQHQSLVGITLTFPGSWCTQVVLFCFVFAFQKSLVGMGFDFNMIAPLLQLLLWTWDIFFLVGSSILLLMVVQQLVAILVFLQEKLSTGPSVHH